MRHSFKKAVLSLCIVLGLAYGAGRLYFRITAGFTEGNITSDFSYDPRWETRALSPVEEAEIAKVLEQPFDYLGKGCQSYVFLSADGQYVIKFFKYQRFRPQFYLHWFSFLPPVEAIRQEKIAKKRAKLDDLNASWKIAFDHLQEETGLVYVHLNKSGHLHKTLKIKDKIGVEHLLDIDRYEFLIQKRADMLCPTLDRYMAEGKEREAKELLSSLLAMILSEYNRGLADNDHALMQNTGVLDGKPVHVDVGQFVLNPSMEDPNNYRQELFNKTYKFRIWLEEMHPELLVHLDNELKMEFGEAFHTMRHVPKPRG